MRHPGELPTGQGRKRRTGRAARKRRRPRRRRETGPSKRGGAGRPVTLRTPQAARSKRARVQRARDQGRARGRGAAHAAESRASSPATGRRPRRPSGRARSREAGSGRARARRVFEAQPAPDPKRPVGRRPRRDGSERQARSGGSDRGADARRAGARARRVEAAGFREPASFRAGEALARGTRKAAVVRRPDHPRRAHRRGKPSEQRSPQHSDPEGGAPREPRNGHRN